MRKLVLAIIVVLAVFTFIREYDPSPSAETIQQAQITTQIIN